MDLGFEVGVELDFAVPESGFEEPEPEPEGVEELELGLELELEAEESFLAAAL